MTRLVSLALTLALLTPVAATASPRVENIFAPSTTWEPRKHAAIVVYGSEDLYHSMVTAAMMWQNTMRHRFTMRVSYQGGEGAPCGGIAPSRFQMVACFTPEYRYEAAWNVLYMAEGTKKSGTIIGCQMMFFARTETDFAIHELGHCLGLGHPSNPASIMFWQTQGDGSQSITQEDIDGLHELGYWRERGKDRHGHKKGRHRGGR